MLHDQKHRERESEVADAVHDECFVACRGSVLFQKVEADQQVTAQSHAFPTHEQQQEILRQHQNQHEKHEQVEVCEKAVVAAFVRHVADRINMDQQADASHHHQHYSRQAIDREINSDFESAALNPGEVMLDVLGIERS